MASIIMPRDIVLSVGGDVLARYGTLVKRNWPADRHGEDAKETASRGSIAGLITAAGNFKSAGNNTPRVTWIKDANGIYQPRLLLEAAATNKLTSPEDLSNAAWTKTRSTVPSTNNTSPRNDATASFLREDASVTTSHYLEQTYTRAAAANTAGVTIFLKANGRTKALWRFADATGEANRYDLTIDLTAGTVVTAAAGSGVATFGIITALTNGWFAVTAYGVPGTGATNTFWRLYLLDASGNVNYTGDGASGMFVWGCVGTDNQVAGMYWGTGASRSADSLSAPFSYKPQALWVYTKFIEQGTARLNNSAGPHSIGSGTVPFSRWDSFANPGYRFSYQGNAGAVVSSPAGVPNVGDLVELLGIIYSDGSVQGLQSINGAADTVGTRSATVALDAAWSAATITIGATTGLFAIARCTVGLGTLPGSIAEAAAAPW